MNESIRVIRPSELSKEELDACISVIEEGDAVDPDTAAAHLPHCVFVAIKRDGQAVVGVGAIKGVRPHYAARRALLSQYDFDPNMHELGYVAVRTSHRKQGIAKGITAALLSALQGQPLWATTSNPHMQKTLGGAGFVQRGEGWRANDGSLLHLWVKT